MPRIAPGSILLLAALGVAAPGCGRGADDAGGADSSASAPPGENQIAVRGVGFATPESVLHDPLTDAYLVSNINGSPLEADDNGFISLLTPEGEVTSLKWIDGASDSVTLHAPKGMAVVDAFLYVADLTTIRRFDRRTGAPRGEFPIPGATFLNDVAAAPDGSVYFTDSGLRAGAGGFEPSGTDAVYRLSPDGGLDTLARGDSLGRPNGIALAGDTVWVVSFGSGELYRVVNGGRADIQKFPKGSLDGLVIVVGDLFVSSWEGATVFRGRPAGSFAEAIRGIKAPADIGHDMWRNRILIPLFNENEVRVVPLAF
jgi:sugar lactone lactonase YvrE